MPCFIGTSGWHYGDWRGRFYPQGMPSIEYLDYYSRFFNTVELNGVFYRMPKPSAVTHWYQVTPKQFRFAYKASRFITHIKKLKEPREPLRLMYRMADRLKEKLAVILFQLPPHWSVDLERLKHFLSALPTGYRHVMEFRHPSWFVPEVYELLDRYRVALCFYDMKGEPSPRVLTAPWVYMRMHGPSSLYGGDYQDTALKPLAKDVKQWAKRQKAVYVYFNNDRQGYAIQNAKRLLELVRPRGQNL